MISFKIVFLAPMKKIFQLIVVIAMCAYCAQIVVDTFQWNKETAKKERSKTADNDCDDDQESEVEEEQIQPLVSVPFYTCFIPSSILKTIQKSNIFNYQFSVALAPLAPPFCPPERM